MSKATIEVPQLWPAVGPLKGGVAGQTAQTVANLDAFVAEHADDVQLFRPPSAQPVIEGKVAMAAHYAANRFNRQGLHAELVNRMVFGNKVIDHERITGLGPHPVDAAVVFEVHHDRITRVWFFSGD